MHTKEKSAVERFIELQRNTSVGEVVSAMTHKLNNYLFLLINYTTFIEGNEEMKKKMAHVVDEMSAYIRSVREKTGREYTWEECEVAEIIEEIFQLRDCWKKVHPGIDLQLKDDAHSVRLRCDKEQLVATLAEMISYACSITTRGVIRLYTTSADDMFQVRVVCEAPSDYTVPLIVPDPFAADYTGEFNFGLAFCKRTAEKHAGVYKIEHDVSGCVQSIVIPIMKHEGDL